MADVVAFYPLEMPPIIEIIDPGAGDIEVLWQEVYSEWKAWLLADLTRLGHPAAFRYVGADPISPTANLGTTYFLQPPWKLRPANRDHKLTLTGNCYIEGGIGSFIVPTEDPHTVLVESRVSNLIDTVATGGGSPAEIAEAVWADDDVYGSGTKGKLVANLDAAVSTRMASGEEVDLTGTERAAVADAVWDESETGHDSGMAALLKALVNGLTEEQATQLLELWRLNALDAEAPLVVSPTARSTTGIDQTIDEADDTVTVTRTP